MISTKKELLDQLKLERRKNENLWTTFCVDAAALDAEVCGEALKIFCSFDIPLVTTEKGGKILFDKKFYAGKARLLNQYGLIFGFILEYASGADDNLKSFLDRFDFAVNQYPNHLAFPQTEILSSETAGDSYDSKSFGPVTSATFSAQNIRQARDICFAARTFYTCGRAVPWFLSVLKPLRITPSAFFADFADWQRCNNADFKSGFYPEKEKHPAIEKMQLLFLEEKYEEKGKADLFGLIQDIVKINGAMSRLSAGEKDEEIVEVSYNPEDLLSEEAMDLESFYDNVCLEECRVRLFAGQDGLDFEIL